MCCPLESLLTKSNTRQTRNKLKVDLPRFKYVLFKRSFAYRGAITWNALPNELRENSSYDSFKRNLSKSDALLKISFGSSAICKSRDHINFIYY